MNNKGIGLIVTVIAIIATLTFLFSWAFGNPTDNISNASNVSVENNKDKNDDDLLSVAHAFGGGIHTYVGEINLPTPCHELSNTITITDSSPENVVISFVTKTETEECVSYIVPEPFSVSFSASRDAKVSMTLNKEPLSFKEVSLDMPNMFEDEEVSTTTNINVEVDSEE